MHTVYLNEKQIASAFTALSAYNDKYSNKLSGKNRMYIQQLLIVCSALNKHCDQKRDLVPVMTANDFLHELAIDHVNVFKLQMYIEESNLSNKVIQLFIIAFSLWGLLTSKRQIKSKQQHHHCNLSCHSHWH